MIKCLALSNPYDLDVFATGFLDSAFKIQAQTFVYFLEKRFLSPQHKSIGRHFRIRSGRVKIMLYRALISFCVDSFAQQIQPFNLRISKSEGSVFESLNLSGTPGLNLIVLVNFGHAHVSECVLDLHFLFDVLLSLFPKE